MALDTDTYDRHFYDTIRPGCQASAAAVVPIILEKLPLLGSVMDVGGGEGWWAQAFYDGGVSVVSVIDGGDIPAGAGAPDVVRFDRDIAEPDSLDGMGAHLALCLEVAEHLPAERAESLVAELCQISPYVLFSAAMPRQGGTGHINCQPPQYWADLFNAHGFCCDGSLRWDIWDLPAVEPWYKSNLLFFTGGNVCARDHAAHPEKGPLHVIHPDLWLANR